jgi:hypothetical protein
LGAIAEGDDAHDIEAELSHPYAKLTLLPAFVRDEAGYAIDYMGPIQVFAFRGERMSMVLIPEDASWDTVRRFAAHINYAFAEAEGARLDANGAYRTYDLGSIMR